MDKNIEELTLLLLYLTSWEEKGYVYIDDVLKEDNLHHSWKGHSFDALNNLTDKGYLFPTKNKNKSVTLTKEGENLAKELIKKYIEK